MQKRFDRSWRRRVICTLLGVLLMGFCLSFLILIDLGTDPCSCINLGLSTKVGISFGTCQMLFNAALFVVVILTDKHQIGIGTVANMVLVGYIADFFGFIWNSLIPQAVIASVYFRLGILLPVLFFFLISVALYMTPEMGVAPYDAMPIIIAKFSKIPFRVVRVFWDISMIIIGFLLGGPVGLVTLIIAFTLGPLVAACEKRIKGFLV